METSYISPSVEAERFDGFEVDGWAQQLIRPPSVNVALRHSRSNQEIAAGGIGELISLRSSNPEPRMSLVGHFRQIQPTLHAYPHPLRP